MVKVEPVSTQNQYFLPLHSTGTANGFRSKAMSNCSITFGKAGGPAC